MKKVFAIAVAALMSLLLAGAAQAANESVTAKTVIEARKGPLYQNQAVSSNLTIRADVTVPDGQPLMLPMKNTKITFPTGLSFNPDPKMPVCDDSKLSKQSPLGSPANVVASCADSVVGTGTSTILLSRQTSVPLKDPILVIFNAGKSADGNPKIKIYGFSKGTGVGILMTGELKNSVLDVAIPVLSYDSAVQYYQFDLPGTGLVRSDIGVDTKGLDPDYVKAICPSSGKLITNAEFVLGERDPATGTDIGASETKSSPETTQDCTGLVAKAKLKATVKGPKSVKNGAKGAFKVTIKNTGTATATGVKVTAKGGKANAGSIAPGAKKTVTVRATVKGKKGRVAKVAFTAKGKGVSAKATAKVKVK